MYSRQTVRRVLVFILTFSILPTAIAGSFRVNPLSISFKPATKATVLKIKNTDSQEVTVQLDSKKWLQDSSGQDYYEDTNEVVFFPKIVNLKPDEERVIRVGYRGQRATQEKTFRLFVQELPNRSGKKGTLNFALRLSIPIFIEVTAPMNKVELAGTLVKAGVASVRIENKGSVHSTVKKINLIGYSDEHKELFSAEADGWYVLNGAARAFEVTLPPDQCRKTKSLRVNVEFASDTKKLTVPMSAAQC